MKSDADQKSLDQKPPEQIAEEIEHSRARIKDTVESLQDKLSPGQLFDQAIGYFRDGPGEYASNLSNTVKQNPVPVALVGIGLAWLMFSNSDSRRQGVNDRRRIGRRREAYETDALYDYDETAYGSGWNQSALAEEPYGATEDGADAATGSRSERLGEGIGRARDRVSETSSRARDRISETSSRARGKLSESAGRAGDWGRDVASKARRKVGYAGAEVRYRAGYVSDVVREQSERARLGVQSLVEEQPLVLAAAGVAFGAALGGALPATRREDELLGGTRDELLSRARQAGEEHLEKAQAVAGAAMEGAKREAKDQGLTPEEGENAVNNLQDKLQRVSASAREEAEREADRQGLKKPGTQTGAGSHGSE